MVKMLPLTFYLSLHSPRDGMKKSRLGAETHFDNSLGTFHTVSEKVFSAGHYGLSPHQRHPLRHIASMLLEAPMRVLKLPSDATGD